MTPRQPDLVALYRTLQLIRRCEEQLARSHQRGLIHGACHTYVGQEAIAAGVCAATVLVAFLSWRAAERFNGDGGVADGHRLAAEQSSQIAQLNDGGGFGRQTGEPIGDEENVLKGLSGAEQEAVLDLIESQAMHKTSLSI